MCTEKVPLIQASLEVFFIALFATLVDNRQLLADKLEKYEQLKAELKAAEDENGWVESSREVLFRIIAKHVSETKLRKAYEELKAEQALKVKDDKEEKV